jgi:hypothetical protein
MLQGPALPASFFGHRIANALWFPKFVQEIAATVVRKSASQTAE